MSVTAEIEVSGDNQRQSSRFSTRLPVGVRRMGSSRIPATVADLSITGFRIQCDERLSKGTVIWIKLGNLAPVTAQVMWVDKLLAGCAFTVPLHPSILENLLRSA